MDATENYGGDGQGLTPMELILVGVARCIGIDVTMLLGKNLENISKIDIQTEGLRREEMQVKCLTRKVFPYFLRVSTIFRKEPACTSSTVTPAFFTSSGSIAPLFSARKKKFSNP